MKKLYGHRCGNASKMPTVRDIQDLRDHITAGCETIRCTPGIFERVRESMRRRVTTCIQENSEHF